MSNYYLVYATSHEDLSNAVANYLAKGWELFGPPVIINTAHPGYIPALRFYQVIIKH